MTTGNVCKVSRLKPSSLSFCRIRQNPTTRHVPLSLSLKFCRPKLTSMCYPEYRLQTSRSSRAASSKSRPHSGSSLHHNLHILFSVTYPRLHRPRARRLRARHHLLSFDSYLSGHIALPFPRRVDLVAGSNRAISLRPPSPLHMITNLEHLYIAPTDFSIRDHQNPFSLLPKMVEGRRSAESRPHRTTPDRGATLFSQLAFNIMRIIHTGADAHTAGNTTNSTLRPTIDP